MINEDATFEQFGYKSTDLKPQSNKKIVAVCDGCGKVRVVGKDKYRDLCLGCSNRTAEHRNNVSEANRCRIWSEETRKKMSESRKGKKHPLYGKARSEETRKKMSKSHTGKKLTEAHRKHIGEAGKGRIFTEEHRMKLSESNRGHVGLGGEKNPMWKGGVSFEPYCPKFNEAFKESIREKFNRTCFLCPTTEAENGRKLSIHHVNYNKDCLCDDSDCEFVPLCSRCHTKTNHNRTYWENLIMDKLAANPRVPASA